MGATNILIVIGPVLAVIVYSFDLLKGLIPVLLAKKILGTDVSMGLAGLAAVLGHDFPVFLGFSGGKGVATMTGAMFGINAHIMWILIMGWIIFSIATNYFIIGSLICMLLLPVLMYFFRMSNTYILFGILYFLAGAFTHRKDVVRIFSGRGDKAFSSVKKYFSR
jgi:glycerol-3-phosphate acyltransferase PlsY